MAYAQIAAVGKLSLDYGQTDNPSVIQTLDNIICFCSILTDVTCAANTVIATLPSTIDKPVADIYFPCIWTRALNRYSGIFILNTNGEIICPTSAMSNSNIYLDGICIHLNNKFYNNTLGNNDESLMTSPLGHGLY